MCCPCLGQAATVRMGSCGWSRPRRWWKSPHEQGPQHVQIWICHSYEVRPFSSRMSRGFWAKPIQRPFKGSWMCSGKQDMPGSQAHTASHLCNYSFHSGCPAQGVDNVAAWHPAEAGTGDCVRNQAGPSEGFACRVFNQWPCPEARFDQTRMQFGRFVS